jgi:hypothetical protein
MSGYYDEATETTYYDPLMVLNITEYDTNGKRDTNIFLIYDEEEDVYYLYGSRGNVRYSKTFDNGDSLYNFISITMGFSENHKVSISVNYMEDLTNYDEYDELKSKVSRFNEVVAYDNVTLSKKRLLRYLNAFN